MSRLILICISQRDFTTYLNFLLLFVYEADTVLHKQSAMLLRHCTNIFEYANYGNPIMCYDAILPNQAVPNDYQPGLFLNSYILRLKLSFFKKRLIPG